MRIWLLPFAAMAMWSDPVIACGAPDQTLDHRPCLDFHLKLIRRSPQKAKVICAEHGNLLDECRQEAWTATEHSIFFAKDDSGRCQGGWWSTPPPGEYDYVFSHGDSEEVVKRGKMEVQANQPFELAVPANKFYDAPLTFHSRGMPLRQAKRHICQVVAPCGWTTETVVNTHPANVDVQAWRRFRRADGWLMTVSSHQAGLKDITLQGLAEVACASGVSMRQDEFLQDVQYRSLPVDDDVRYENNPLCDVEPPTSWFCPDAAEVKSASIWVRLSSGQKLISSPFASCNPEVSKKYLAEELCHLGVRMNKDRFNDRVRLQRAP